MKVRNKWYTIPTSSEIEVAANAWNGSFPLEAMFVTDVDLEKYATPDLGVIHLSFKEPLGYLLDTWRQ